MLRPVSRLRIALTLSTVLAAGVAGGCNSDSTSDPQTPRSLAIASGDSQSVEAGSPVANPLTVRVLGDGSRPVSGTSVFWAVASGGGKVTDTASTTDANGEAKMNYTTGTTAGTAKVTATVGGLVPVTFTVTLKAGPVSKLTKFGFENPAALAGSQLALTVKASDQYGNGIQNIAVTWTASSDAALSDVNGTTDAGGVTKTTVTLAQRTGIYTVTATAPGLGAVTFTITAI
jgi:hypothetical protein